MSSASGTDTSLEEATSKSTSTFLAALIAASVIAGLEVLAFVLLRATVKKVYAPRTYLSVPSKRSEIAPWTPWGWLLPTIRYPSEAMIARSGLDAFVYIRFLKMVVYIFAFAVVVTWPVLLPLDAFRTEVPSDGMNSFTIGNIPNTLHARYWGHLVIAWTLTFWVFFLIKREMSHYVALRQAYLISDQHVSLPQATTVLCTGVPKEYVERDALLRITSRLPGGVKRVWICRALKDLPDLYKDRLAAADKLESAETKLCKIAVQLHAERQKAAKNANDGGGDGLLEGGSLTLSDRLVPRKKRPKHRLGFWGLWGKKVDTIDWAKEEIVRLTAELNERRKRIDDHPSHNSVFIQFNNQLAAHIFAQAVIHHQPLRMAQKYVDVAPEDIIMDNLNLNPYDLKIRSSISWIVAIGLVILWSFPVTLVGIISNVDSLCQQVPWLSWICRAPSVIVDVIKGILPPVLLVLLFLLLPVILRLLGRYSGNPKISEIELNLMKRYYLFLVVHGFLVTTLSSGLTVAIPQIAKDPSQAVSVLSSNMPKASIFFMTYVTTTSLTGVAGALLQIGNLMIYYVKLFLLASTPRSVFNIKFTMPSPAFGTLFPNTTLLVTIGLTYSVISPIMAGLCLFGFGCFWLGYKYLFLYVFDVQSAHETGGRFFPLAIMHLFTGLYLSQACLACLFFLAQDSAGKASSVPQGVLMIVLIAVTIWYQLLINGSYVPLIQYVPFTLEDPVKQKYGKDGVSAEEVRREPEIDNNVMRHEGFEMEERGATKKPLQEDTVVVAQTKEGGTDSAVGLEEKVELGRNAFAHPAIWESTRPIWVPDEGLGLGKSEVADLRHHNIPASTAGAGMTSEGKVYVTRSPPENIEVIEMTRHHPEGCLAMPGAIRLGPRSAVHKFGTEAGELNTKIDEVLHRSSGARKNPPKASTNRRLERWKNKSSGENTSDSEEGNHSLDSSRKDSDEDFAPGSAALKCSGDI